MNKVVLYGASGHGKVIAEIVQNLSLEILCFVDDDKTLSCINNIPVCLPSEIKDLVDTTGLIISIGNNNIRKKISSKIKAKYISLVDSSAAVSSFAEISEGSVVMPKAVINANVKIGKHCIINTASIVEHDCIIEDFVHISPGACVTGNSKIGEGTHIGANATIIPNITIGNWVTIGAGAVVLNDIPDHAVLVGNPGKIIKNSK